MVPQDHSNRRRPAHQEHVVQFYRDDHALLHQLQSHIGAALANSSSAVVIATPGRRDALTHRLKSDGINLVQATSEGRYTALDAAEMLRILLVDGRPHQQRFEQVIAPVVARATAASLAPNRRVVAFGEMVGLLWAEGKPEIAIELEQLWNQLAKTHAFSLRCGYPMPGFCREDMAESLLKICAEHTSVLHAEATPTPSPVLPTSIESKRLSSGAGRHRTSKLWSHYESENRVFPERIVTSRLELRRYVTRDVPSLLQLLEPNREQLIREFPQMAWLRSGEEAESFMLEKLEQWNAGKAFCYGIWRTADDCQVGQLQVKNITWEIPSAELSYFIGGSFQRQGYASESVRSLLRAAFEDLGFQRVYLRILQSNNPSFSLAEKLGFHHEGVHRKAFRCGFGQLHEVHYMSLTADEHR